MNDQPVRVDVLGHGISEGTVAGVRLMPTEGRSATKEGPGEGRSPMAYSVMLDAIDEPGFEGCYYALIPALDLTTHGKGIDGALAAAKELAEVWIAEKRAQGESVPR